MDRPDDGELSLLQFCFLARGLPVLRQTYLVTKCLVANFTRVRSESINLKKYNFNAFKYCVTCFHYDSFLHAPLKFEYFMN